ncbi:rod-binding protein [Bremerella sp. JC770]|uniref:rod-binding protein n=1 Tax=Bremerella sp. JC770 TaxID=3232137 RepID=UPI003457D679
MNVSTLNSASGAAAPQGQLREKFDQFVGESMFGQMLKSMRESLGKPAYFHGGRAEEVFQSQLDQLLVEKISDASAEQISEPMFELFTANMGNRHEASELSSFVSEDEAQEAIQQLGALQQQNQAHDSETNSAALSQLDLSI